MERLCAVRPVTLLCQLQADTALGQAPTPFLPAMIAARML